MCTIVNNAVPSHAFVMNISKTGTSRAGNMYILTCSASRNISGLINTPTVAWNYNERPTLLNISSNNTNSTSILTFLSLHTSHGGVYYCNGSLTSPALEIPLKQSRSEEIIVQSKRARALYIAVHILAIRVDHNNILYLI